MTEERDTTLEAEGQAPDSSPAPEAAAAEAAQAAAGRPDPAAAQAAAPDDDDVADHAVDAAVEPPEPDYKDLYLRAAAETDNVRKRARRDVEAANARGVAR